MSTVFYYVQASIVCILIHGIFLFNEKRSAVRRDQQIILQRILIFQMVYFFADCFWSMIDGNLIPKTYVTMAIINCIIYTLTCGTSYNWFLYEEVLSGNPRLKDSKSRMQAVMPLIVTSLFVITAFLIGKGFYIEDDGDMHRPYLYYSTLMVPIAYIIFMCYQSFRKALTRESASERTQYLSLAMYPVILLCSAVLQLFDQRIPIMCYGATLAVIYVYVISLATMISSDPLTQLNNRNQLERFIAQIDREYIPQSTGYLYVFMMDIDFFKSINDSYGHQEGDHALVLASTALKQVCDERLSDRRPFLVRYGGDEFLLAAFAKDMQEVEAICARIKEKLSQMAEKEKLPYDLKFSIGYSMLRGMQDSMKECIQRADEHLLELKRHRNTLRH
ncbi:MAG: GGDEF domain-containing protein [Blautia sp.]|nr:GGDEF domain-containing protein [Blautia sp.]